MRVAELETYIVATPPPHIGGMYWLFVRLKTACGIEGVGEIYSATFHPDAQVNMISDVFNRYLLGHDPHHIERFYREAYSSGFTQRPDLSMMGIFSGLETDRAICKSAALARSKKRAPWSWWIHNTYYTNSEIKL